MDLNAEIIRCVRSGNINVPPYPAVAMRLAKLMGDEGHSMTDVVAAVSADPTLAAVVLRLANSAMYRGGGEVTSMQGAIMRIGEKELSRIALAAGLSSHALEKGPLGTLRRGAWHRSLTSALVSEVLGRLFRLDGAELFVCGLLHDVGALLALRTLERLLKAKPDEPALAESTWSQLVEKYHLELGLVLATTWELPQVTTDCISQHHQATPDTAFAKHLVVMQVADRVVALLDRGVEVTSDSLQSLELLTEPQRSALVEALPRVPSMVASFEDAEAVESSPSLVLPTSPSQLLGRSPFAVNVLGNNPVLCLGVGMSGKRVAFTSPARLATNYVFEVELKVAARTGKFWVKVSRCEELLERFHVEAVPFALSGAAAQAWKTMATAVAPGASSAEERRSAQR